MENRRETTCANNVVVGPDRGNGKGVKMAMKENPMREGAEGRWGRKEGVG